MTINFLLFIFAGTFTFFTLTPIYKMLLDRKCITLNYKSNTIPTGLGIAFVFNQSIFSFIIYIIGRGEDTIILIYIISIVLMGLSGLLDDLIGDKNVKGFKGHIKLLIKGELTTGGLKAIVGIILSIIISFTISNNIFEVLINIIIISLFTNLVNLLDLRPGRAGKLFVLVSIGLLVINPINRLSAIIFTSLGIIIVYLPLDLKRKGMMGDVGSNTLGITLGIYSSFSSNYSIKIVQLFILVSLQILSEYYSFSTIIKNNRILRKIDNLGR